MTNEDRERWEEELAELETLHRVFMTNSAFVPKRWEMDLSSVLVGYREVLLKILGRPQTDLMLGQPAPVFLPDLPGQEKAPPKRRSLNPRRAGLLTKRR